MKSVFSFSVDGGNVSVIRASCEMNVETVMFVSNFDRGHGV
jgi:hypothetical protein